MRGANVLLLFSLCAAVIFCSLTVPFYAEAAPSVGAPAVSPSSVIGGQETTLTVTSLITSDPANPVIATGVNLLRVGPGDRSRLGEIAEHGGFHMAECPIALQNALTTGSRLGWRLPALQELASLVDKSVPPPGPTLPSGHPFSNIQSSDYWSATTNAFLAAYAWGVSFYYGVVANIDGPGDVAKAANNYAWCVRGGQGVDPQ